MKSVRLLPVLSFALAAVAGCGKTEPDPVAKILAKKPAFLRICNFSPSTFTSTLNGAAFGPEFTPGTSTSLSRIPTGTAKLQLTPSGALPSPLEVPAQAGEGTTLFIFDPGKPNGFAIVSGDLYEAPSGEARMRAVGVASPTTGTILRDGEPWHSLAGDASGSAIAAADVGKTIEFKLTGTDGKVVAKAMLTPESGRSYTILARSEAGKPMLQVLVNNPPLSPRGRQGMMGSS